MTNTGHDTLQLHGHVGVSLQKVTFDYDLFRVLCREAGTNDIAKYIGQFSNNQAMTAFFFKQMVSAKRRRLSGGCRRVIVYTSVLMSG
jgi:hypothetical protein